MNHDKTGAVWLTNNPSATWAVTNYAWTLSWAT
jgi:hypothetical protein